MKFFVTHGQGLELFVQKELVKNFTDNLDVEVSKESHFHGKIIFSAEVKHAVHPRVQTSQACESEQECGIIAKHLIASLKTVERIFGFLFEDKHVDLSIGNDRKNALSNLHSYISKISSTISPLLDSLYKFQGRDKNPCSDDSENALEWKRRKKSRSFRVNAKVSGKFKRLLKSNLVAPCIGSALVKALNNLSSWEIDLRNPTLEISVYLTDDGILCGVALVRHPLSERAYLNKIPLRSTVAYCMGSLAVEGEALEPNNLVVMDPMCGSSVILIELVKHFPQVHLAFGIDNDFVQVQEAIQNVHKAELSANIFTVLSDSAKEFPFRDNLVFDAVVCDVPFGIQHNCVRDGENILHRVLSNVDRVVKPQGNIVLLISLQMNVFIDNVLSENKLSWTLKNKYPLKLGELPALICHYKK